MEAAGRPPSIRDVARAAGVSTATVSHVYNHKGEVAEATRERVLRIGRELGYRPNAIGQALRSGRSRVLGIVVSYRDSAVWEQTYMPYYRNVIAGAAIEAVGHGYAIAAAPSRSDGTIETALPLDGIILVDPVAPDAVVEECLRAGTAVVTDGGYPGSGSRSGLRSVSPDLDRGIPELLDHLAGNAGGRLRPALLVGPRLDSYSAETIEHFRTWCEVHATEPVVWAVPETTDPRAAVEDLLAQGAGAGVDAVHCLNETYAHAVTAAATALGIDLSGGLQVSLVGNAYAVGADPRAAYLHVDPAETGARCVRTLIALVEGGDAPDVVFEPALVPRRG